MPEDLNAVGMALLLIGMRANGRGNSTGPYVLVAGARV